MWASQWNMTKIAAPAAWDTQTDGHDVAVAIIDTGIDFAPPDLSANLDSANSFTCMGACVVGGLDDFGHGAHVAGTIGAAANNGAGIAGINWRVKMISLKFLNSGGSGYLSDAVLAYANCGIFSVLARDSGDLEPASPTWAWRAWTLPIPAPSLSPKRS